MKRSNLLKLLFPILFVLAALFGLFQHKLDPYLGQKRYSISKAPSSNGDLQYYYQKAQDLSKQSTANASTTFLAVGDIMLSRNVAQVIKDANNPLLPFSQMSEQFKEADFSFGNLESPIAATGGIIGGHSMVFAAPKGNVQGLVENKFKVLNLANNHALDQGVKGLAYTGQYLKDSGIKHTGTGNNLNDAWQPAVTDTNGIKICFLGASYASINDSGQTKNQYVARIDDLENLKSQIEKSKSLCDFVVVTMHAGTEYTRKPNPAQVDFAHKAIDYGANLVIGGHPHWVQTMEKYNGKYIFYSLGNFIFDQDWSRDTMEGLALKVQVSKRSTPNTTTANAATLDDLQGTRIPANLDKIELIPVIIENHSTPRPATPEEAKKILNKIGVSESTLN